VTGYRVVRDNELYHYGVKGMKWGVRRTAAQLGHLVKKGASKIKDRISESNEKRKIRKQNEANKRKPVSEMTDDELKQRLNRLDMEKRYSDYMKTLNPKKESRVKKVVGEILSSGIKTISNAGIQKISNALLGDKDEASDYSFSNLSKVGDKKLKNAIQRLNMEKQYDKLRQEKIDNGRKAFQEAFQANAPNSVLLLPAPKNE
jgi:hypothetical protein